MMTVLDNIGGDFFFPWPRHVLFKQENTDVSLLYDVTYRQTYRQGFPQ